MKTTRTVFAFAAILCLGLCSWAQTLSGPSAGFIFDASTRSIRSLAGTPGAAYLGDPRISDIDLASVAPDARHALAARGERILLFALDNPSDSGIELGRLSAAPARLTWNSEGNAALAFSPGSGQLLLFRNLASPAPAVAVLDAAALGPEVACLTIDRSGQRIIALATGSEKPGVYLLEPASTPRLLLETPQARALAWNGDTQAAYLLTSAGTEIVELRGLPEAPVAIPFAGVPQDSVYPSRLALSRDSRFLYVTDAGAQSLSVFDTTTRMQLETLWIPSAADDLLPVPPHGYFLLTSRRGASQPLYLVDPGVPPAVFFVPARSSNGEGDQQ